MSRIVSTLKWAYLIPELEAFAQVFFEVRAVRESLGHVDARLQEEGLQSQSESGVSFLKERKSANKGLLATDGGILFCTPNYRFCYLIELSQKFYLLETSSRSSGFKVARLFKNKFKSNISMRLRRVL